MIFKIKDTSEHPINNVDLSASPTYFSLEQKDWGDGGINVVLIPLRRVPAFIKALLKVYLKSLKGTK